MTGVDPKGEYASQPGVVGHAVQMAMEAQPARPAPKPVPVIDTLPPQPDRSGPPTMTLIALVVFVALLAVAIITKG